MQNFFVWKEKKLHNTIVFLSQMMYKKIFALSHSPSSVQSLSKRRNSLKLLFTRPFRMEFFGVDMDVVVGFDSSSSSSLGVDACVVSSGEEEEEEDENEEKLTTSSFLSIYLSS